MLNINNININEVYRFNNGSCRRGINVMYRDGEEAPKPISNQEHKISMIKMWLESGVSRRKFDREIGEGLEFTYRAVRDYLAGKLGVVDQELADKKWLD